MQTTQMIKSVMIIQRVWRSILWKKLRAKAVTITQKYSRNFMFRKKLHRASRIDNEEPCSNQVLKSEFEDLPYWTYQVVVVARKDTRKDAIKTLRLKWTTSPVMRPICLTMIHLRPPRKPPEDHRVCHNTVKLEDTEQHCKPPWKPPWRISLEKTRWSRVPQEGDAAKVVLKDSLQDLILMCQHVRSTFDKSVADFKLTSSYHGMDTH